MLCDSGCRHLPRDDGFPVQRRRGGRLRRSRAVGVVYRVEGGRKEENALSALSAGAGAAVAPSLSVERNVLRVFAGRGGGDESH
jgi:hypothetical protein